MADIAAAAPGEAAARAEAPMMEDLFGDEAPEDNGDAAGSSVSPANGLLSTAASASASGPTTLNDIFGDVSDDDADVVLAPAGATVPLSAAADASAVQSRPPGWRMSFGPGAANAGASQSASELHLPFLPAVAADRVQSVRLPKIVTVASDAYDPDAYDEDAETAALSAADKLAARDSVIRWRVRPAGSSANGAGAGAGAGAGVGSGASASGSGESSSGDGAHGVESNARVVEWSDGSLTLHVGRQVFALSTQRTGGSGSGAGEALQAFARVTAVHGHANGSAGAGKRTADAAAAAVAGGSLSAPSGPRETVLVGRQLVSSRLLVRSIGGAGGSGTSASSALLVGAGLGGGAGAGSASGGTAAAAGRPAATRVALQQVNLLADPEREKMARIRAEEEAARALENQKRAGEAAARKAGRRFGAAGGMDEDYGYAGGGAGGGDEAELGLGDGEEEETSLKALKARASGRGRGRGRGRGGAAGRAARAADSDGSDEGSGSEDSGAEDDAPKRRGKKPAPKRIRKTAAAAGSSSDEDSASESGSDDSSDDSDSSSDSSGSGSSSGDSDSSSGGDSSSGSDE